MSVIIRGMKMPKSCMKCLFRSFNKYDGCTFDCLLTGKGLAPNNMMDTKRQDDCPLVPIKTPHGRLIDVDALIAKEKVEYEKEDSELEPTSIERLALGCSHAIILGVLSEENAPTILDREE